MYLIYLSRVVREPLSPSSLLTPHRLFFVHVACLAMEKVCPLGYKLGSVEAFPPWLPPAENVTLSLHVKSSEVALGSRGEVEAAETSHKTTL